MRGHDLTVLIGTSWCAGVAASRNLQQAPAPAPAGNPPPLVPAHCASPRACSAKQLDADPHADPHGAPCGLAHSVN